LLLYFSGLEEGGRGQNSLRWIHAIPLRKLCGNSEVWQSLLRFPDRRSA